MDRDKAIILVENLLDRLVADSGRFRLPEGLLSGKEREALAALAGLAPLPESDRHPPAGVANDEGASDSPIDASAPAVHRRAKLNLDCLEADLDDSALLCIDFGTAYSKAAIWKDGDDAPVPLDLGLGAGGNGLLVDSAAFIDRDHLFFGPGAIQAHSALADVERCLFASPKELLTHDHETFHTSRPNAEVDPTGQFKSRDLLALYLAYLTALSSDRAIALGVGKHVVRRFAAPGWSNAQISASSPHFEFVVSQMNELLVDAQILVDSLPAEAWRDGLDVGLARSALNELGLITADRKRKSQFIQRPVLEAVAAATGVQDRLVNKRPQVLVVDVGAGTTDIGAFKYSITSGAARVSTYKNGLSALQMAGNRLDDALIELAWAKMGYASDSQLRSPHARKMRVRVRNFKSELFATGAVAVDLDGFGSVSIERDEFESIAPVRYLVSRFEASVKQALNGAGVGSKNFLETNEPNVAVFTGGGGSIPALRNVFAKPLELDGGKAFFEVVDPIPEWVDDFGPDVRQTFPQLAVATGGCAPNLPDEKSAVLDTSVAGERSLMPTYR
jgi:hypothetical protein